MGSHRNPQSLLARFLRWRRYRSYLATLIRDDRRRKRPLTAERMTELKRDARAAARRVDDDGGISE